MSRMENVVRDDRSIYNIWVVSHNFSIGWTLSNNFFCDICKFTKFSVIWENFKSTVNKLLIFTKYKNLVGFLCAEQVIWKGLSFICFIAKLLIENEWNGILKNHLGKNCAQMLSWNFYQKRFSPGPLIPENIR
jgi:hypothetical protein